jgi:hypothetical protein
MRPIFGCFQPFGLHVGFRQEGCRFLKTIFAREKRFLDQRAIAKARRLLTSFDEF